jgi:hypothetical protein
VYARSQWWVEEVERVQILQQARLTWDFFVKRGEGYGAATGVSRNLVEMLKDTPNIVLLGPAGDEVVQDVSCAMVTFVLKALPTELFVELIAGMGLPFED